MTTDESEGYIEKYDDMFTEAIRLKSFQKWPFGDDAKCSAAKMAEAGFFHCPNETELDSVQCYVCFKELDGWDASDEPWAEHLSHSKICVFAKIGKPQKDLTAKEVFRIEMERKVNKNKRITAQLLYDFRKMSEEAEDFFVEMMEKTESERKKK
ncbi:hypothetical protein JTE90_004486 [Oedothorax gibbosus]|uniref:Survivin n=1 Tax=Oedothorax gibbosus TaxID=931172 RepID=A0AAV6U2P6_9ARAC|nr:hypothetical protein JTE90_004486 [Oedothorax gibbosus]